MKIWAQISAMVLVGVIVAGSVMYFIPYIQRRSLTGGEVLCTGLTFSTGDIHDSGRLMASRGDEIYMTVLLFQDGGDLSSRGTLRVVFREVGSKDDSQIIENRISLGADMAMPISVGPFYIKSPTPIPITYGDLWVFWNDDYLPCYDYREKWRNV